jgi:hypothetical protein
MPKRLTLTLSDEAAALLQEQIPYHNRGAYVSELILVAGGRQDGGKPRCRCGVELDQRVYFEHGVWAATADDLRAYRERRKPAHDVVAGTGKRLRLGHSNAYTPAES